jgi:hypothetical protein
MKNKIITLLLTLGTASFGFGQHTLYTANSAIELSGNITTFYNYRFYPKDEKDKDKNRFVLDYCTFRLDGNSNKLWNYQLQLNAAALGDAESSDGFIMEARAGYTSLRDNFSIQAGYDKVPFGRYSLLSNSESVFLQRPEVSRGGAFNRRDAGTTLKYNLFNKKLVLIGGVYTGMGAGSLSGKNDNSGKLEYVARTEISYPARMRYKEVDYTNTALPHLAIGGGVRYAEKSETTGVDYPIQTIDGKKLSYSTDFTFCYKGFTLMAEWIEMKCTPNDSTLLLGKPTSFFKAGGTVVGLTYFFSPLNSVLGIRYDEFNPNDLKKGDTKRTVSFAYNYAFPGGNTSIKLHYFKRIKDSDEAKVFTDDQIRIGLQVLF